MKHPQFEALLFDIDHLGHEERIALEAHLRECEHCNVLATSWSDLEGNMLSAPKMEPATGFTERFRERLVVYKRRKQERKLACYPFPVIRFEHEQQAFLFHCQACLGFRSA